MRKIVKCCIYRNDTIWFTNFDSVELALAAYNSLFTNGSFDHLPLATVALVGILEDGENIIISKDKI